MKKLKKSTWYKIAGISGIALGLFMIYQYKNSMGSIPLAVGIGFLLWRHK